MNNFLFPVLANPFGPQGLLIFGIILLLFGAKKLPELARGLGLAIKEFSKAKNDIQDEILREPTPQPAKQIDADVAKTEAPAGTKAQTETHV
jgi:sec-independent protein translocase protein TatA